MSRLSRAIQAYYEKLDEYSQRGLRKELSIRPAFFNLLDETKPEGWLVEAESTVKVGGKNIYPDAVIKDRNQLTRGYYEAKDRDDDLDTEMVSKRGKGYSFNNILFENSLRAVLIQDGSVVHDRDIRDPAALERVLSDFYRYEEPNVEQFEAAVDKFREDIPKLSADLQHTIHDAKTNSREFRDAFTSFLELCRQAIDPRLSEQAVEEMLVQHLLTERLMRSIFQLDRFNQDNAIAREIDKVITALTGRGFQRSEFEHRLDYFYKAIEQAADGLPDFSEKQRFINTVYERFFQGYAADVADTHGIVYTPQEIVQFMCAAVEEVLQTEFGLELFDESVYILDPATGTGNFIVNLMRRIHESNPLALKRMYENQLYANEVMLLAYYIASLNIEHEYYALTKNWQSFEGLAFVDTLDLAERKGQPSLGLFAEENTGRVNREKAAPITVVIANPPYNVGQRSGYANNQNRAYPIIDREIRESYAKDSAATNKNALADMYVKFFRWATDRLEGRDGIVCFVSNNSFVDQIAFDGMRRHLLQDFTRIYHIDLHGNVRHNPKLSGTTHNVFGIQVGVGITVAIRSSQHSDRKLYYHRVPEFWRRGEKLAWLAELIQAHTTPLQQLGWEELTPDSKHSWFVSEYSDEFSGFLSIGNKEAKEAKEVNVQTVFKLYSRGLETTRDEWVYGYNERSLSTTVAGMIEVYNSEVDRWRRAGKPSNVDEFVTHDSKRIKWSSGLIDNLRRERYATLDSKRFKKALYRPFNKQFVFFDPILNHRQGVLPVFFPKTESENIAIIVSDIGSEKPFMILVADDIPDLHLVGAGSSAQTFALYTYDENGSNRRENVTDWALAQFQLHYGDSAITKDDIFYYVYGLLHHPDYRTRYADNLKRELPRIPFAPDFHAFSRAGRDLARLHLDYEQIKPYRLAQAVSKDAREPEVWRVRSKMKLDKAGGTLTVNPMLTLSGIPPQVHDYRLGNRSALEWIVEQYRVKDGSDPNRYKEDDPEYIVRLVGQVVQVSLDTVRIVGELAALPYRP